MHRYNYQLRMTVLFAFIVLPLISCGVGYLIGRAL